MTHRRRVLLRGALGVGLAVAVFVEVLPRIAGYGSVGHRLAAVSVPWAAALAAAAALDVLTAALPWLVLLPQLSFLGALGFTQASTALTTVLPGGAPLGMALSYGLLRRLRMSGREAGFAVAVTGVWSQVTILLYPLVGAALVFGSGRLSGTTAAIAGASGVVGLVAVGATAAALRSRSTARRISRTAQRAAAPVARILRREPPSWEESVVSLRDELVPLLRRHWLALTGATLGNQLTAYLVLDFSLRAVGTSVHALPPTETFLAWSVGRVLSTIPLTPAGVGFVELGMIGTLVGFGAGHAHVVAAVLLYRGLVIVPTLVVGAVALLVFRVRRTPAAAKPS